MRLNGSVVVSDSTSSAPSPSLSNASLYGLDALVAHTHSLETALQEDARTLTPDEAARLWSIYETTLERLAPVVGRTDTLVLGTDEIEALARAIALGEPHDEHAVLVRRWTWGALSLRLHGFAEQACPLAAHLDKAPIGVSVHATDPNEAPGALAEFWAAFGHVIQNAVDHGPETTAVRRQLGKGEGHLSLSANLEDGHLVVRLTADGAGIDRERLRAKARDAGLPHASCADLEQALFADGVSTAQAVSEISGRGVGMAEVLKLGGTIAMASTPRQGARFLFRFPAEGRVQRIALGAHSPDGNRPDDADPVTAPPTRSSVQAKERHPPGGPFAIRHNSSPIREMGST